MGENVYPLAEAFDLPSAFSSALSREYRDRVCMILCHLPLADVYRSDREVGTRQKLDAKRTHAQLVDAVVVNTSLEPDEAAMLLKAVLRDPHELYENGVSLHWDEDNRCRITVEDPSIYWNTVNLDPFVIQPESRTVRRERPTPPLTIDPLTRGLNLPLYHALAERKGPRELPAEKRDVFSALVATIGGDGTEGAKWWTILGEVSRETRIPRLQVDRYLTEAINEPEAIAALTGGLCIRSPKPGVYTVEEI